MRVPESFARAACAIETLSWNFQQHAGLLHEHFGSTSCLQRVASRLDDGVYNTIAQPVRGALLARRLGRPLTQSLDLFFGTGRRHHPVGVTDAGAAAGRWELLGHQERVEYLGEMFASYKAHPTDVGVCGILGWIAMVPAAGAATAVGFAMGATLGAVAGCARYPFRSRGNAAAPSSFAAFFSQNVRGSARNCGHLAGAAAILAITLPLMATRCATLLVKAVIAGVGTGAGFLAGMGQLVGTELGLLIGLVSPATI